MPRSAPACSTPTCAGIIHRDLKRSNILVIPAGEVRLLDFGIAKLLDGEVPVIERPRTGVRAFTLHYAAPEQIRGEPVTTMTDVYSLGVVLYELLTDCKPYRLKRDSDAAWEEAILLSDPRKPSQMVLRRLENDTGALQSERLPELRRRARLLAGDLDNIVLKALSKRPEQRYPSVGFNSRIAVIAIYAIRAEWNFQLDFLILQDDSVCTV